MYPKPANEELRLHSLYEYDILDSIAEEDYDNITTIAAQICNAEVSLITLIDQDRQWFKSHYGTDIQETPREIAFCNYTITDKDNVLVVPDLRTDPRFAKNPLVTGDPNVVFYAGAPLTTPEGFVLGSICVLDKKIKTLNKYQVNALKALARELISMLELRKKIKELEATEQQLKCANTKLKKFAQVVSHDIKTPVANIVMVTNTFQNCYADGLGKEANECLDLISRSAKEQLTLINDVLGKFCGNYDDDILPEQANMDDVINKVINLVGPPDDIEIKFAGGFPAIPMDQVSARQVFQNLITNAIKYNDKPKGRIVISSAIDESWLYFTVSDNGPGIEKKHLGKIFKEGQTLNRTDRYGNKGTGFGLATIKDIVENSGGKITVNSKINIGTDFIVSMPRLDDIMPTA